MRPTNDTLNEITLALQVLVTDTLHTEDKSVLAYAEANTRIETLREIQDLIQEFYQGDE